MTKRKIGNIMKRKTISTRRARIAAVTNKIKSIHAPLRGYPPKTLKESK